MCCLDDIEILEGNNGVNQDDIVGRHISLVTVLEPPCQVQFKGEVTVLTKHTRLDGEMDVTTAHREETMTLDIVQVALVGVVKYLGLAFVPLGDWLG